ncbi:MAG: thiamine-phosphate kinase [Chthoniobacterales bacterium]
MKLRQIGEDALLAKLISLFPADRRVVAGSGDDAAIVRGDSPRDLLVLKTDCVVRGIHFEGNASPEAVGWKAMMRPLSDFAAVSAVPEFALITLIVNRDMEVSWVAGVYRGLNRAACKFNVSIVGGETSSIAGPAAISVSVTGTVEKDRWVSRRGGRPGDRIFVTGRLGNSIRGRHLRFIPRIEESRWLTAHFRIHAMIDLSDGLGADLPRLAAASRVGFIINSVALPLSAGATVDNAISDGEDYELLFTVSGRDAKRLPSQWRKKFPGTRLTDIGSLIPRTSTRGSKLKGGYIHFQ